MKKHNVMFFVAVFIWLTIIIGFTGSSKAQSTESTAAITMREYVDMRVAEIQRATDKALESLNSRLLAMNEFRASINDANKTFVTKDTIVKIEDDIRALRTLADIAQGKASQTSFFVAMFLSMASFIISGAGLISKFNEKRANGKTTK